MQDPLWQKPCTEWCMAAYRFAICMSVLVALLTGQAVTLRAQSLKSQEFEEGATKGFDHVYNLDYEEARAAFENLRQQYPRHPGPPLYLALTLWQRELFRRQDLGLDRLVAPESFIGATAQPMAAEDRKEFFKYLAEY